MISFTECPLFVGEKSTTTPKKATTTTTRAMKTTTMQYKLCLWRRIQINQQKRQVIGFSQRHLSMFFFLSKAPFILSINVRCVCLLDHRRKNAYSPSIVDYQCINTHFCIKGRMRNSSPSHVPRSIHTKPNWTRFFSSSEFVRIRITSYGINH